MGCLGFSPTFRLQGVCWTAPASQGKAVTGFTGLVGVIPAAGAGVAVGAGVHVCVLAQLSPAGMGAHGCSAPHRRGAEESSPF